MTGAYVHGYSQRERERLVDQAEALVELIHAGTTYPAGSSVLEVGCGVGAQTVTLAERSPEARVTAVDVSRESLEEAARRVERAGLSNVEFRQADIDDLPFDAGSFDHVFVCFVLEHLPDPPGVLWLLRRVLRPGGSITVVEGDHGSARLRPDDPAAHAAIGCLVTLQHAAGGDALIGRRIGPLMAQAGFAEVTAAPRTVRVHPSRPDLVDAVTRRTFTSMVEQAREPAIAAGLIDPATFDAGIAALLRTAEPGGLFSYTFFKGVGRSLSILSC